MLIDIHLSQSKILNIIIILRDASTIIDLVFEFVLTSSLETVFEHGNILNPLEPIRNGVGVNEKSSHDHQGDDKDGDECHGEFHIGHEDGDDKSVGRSVPVDENRDQNKHPEAVSLVDESDSEIGDGDTDCWVEELEGEFSQALAPEIGSDTVGFIQSLS